MPEPDESVQHSSGIRREERPVERLLEHSPKKSPAINKFNSFYIAVPAGRQSQLLVSEEFVGGEIAATLQCRQAGTCVQRSLANLAVKSAICS